MQWKTKFYCSLKSGSGDSGLALHCGRQQLMCRICRPRLYSVKSAIVRISEILYPADRAALLDDVCERNLEIVTCPEDESLLRTVLD
eukprot:IDg11451t1